MQSLNKLTIGFKLLSWAAITAGQALFTGLYDFFLSRMALTVGQTLITD